MSWLIRTFFLSTIALVAVVESAHHRKWPPAYPSLLKDPVTGTYDIRINPHLKADAFTHNAVCNYAKHFEKKYRKSGEGNCFQRAVNALSKNIVSSWDYYPQPVDHFRILREVRAGSPVYEAPQNDPPRYILKAPTTCDKNRDLVIMIESCVTCSDRRAKSRSTFLNKKLWPNVNIGWVFVTGVPARSPEKRFYFYGMSITRKLYKSDTNTISQLSALLSEAGKYGDILVGDFEQDSYHHVWSYIVAIRWASAFCNKKVPIFVYMQGQYSLVPYKFLQWFKRLSSNRKSRYFGGHVHKSGRPIRKANDPWSQTVEEMPWSIYPPYVFRGLAVLGHDTVQEAAILSAFTRYNRILSVYMAIVNRRVRIHPSHIDGVRDNVRSAGDARNAILGPTSQLNKYMNWATGRAK